MIHTINLLRFESKLRRLILGTAYLYIARSISNYRQTEHRNGI